MRTLILVAAAAGVIAAFRTIGDTFLVVFVGIFLALVFEYPVRFVMTKTRLSRGLAATVTVIGSAIVVVALLLVLLVPLAASARDVGNLRRSLASVLRRDRRSAGCRCGSASRRSSRGGRSVSSSSR